MVLEPITGDELHAAIERLSQGAAVDYMDAVLEGTDKVEAVLWAVTNAVLDDIHPSRRPYVAEAIREAYMGGIFAAFSVIEHRGVI